MQKTHEIMSFKCSGGFIWRFCKIKCNMNTISVRKDPKFENIKLSLGKILEIIYEWSINTKIKIIRRKVDVDYRIINTILNLIRKFLKKEEIKKIGGPGFIVEIDKSAMSRRKYNKGKYLKKQLWCVGGFCRESKECFFELTLSRNQDTLHSIILKYVNVGTLIYSDECKRYRRINEKGFIKKSICHKSNFVDADNPFTHTQNIEVIWKWLKDYRKNYGNNIKKNHKNYILKYKLKKNEDNVFEKLFPRLRCLNISKK